MPNTGRQGRGERHRRRSAAISRVTSSTTNTGTSVATTTAAITNVGISSEYTPGIDPTRLPPAEFRPQKTSRKEGSASASDRRGAFLGVPTP
ncbi:hypothetical protein [Rhodococcoides fascians]|uniref:hypothetical protein n=1 Tax=Rhodococcoides fascians TaxID=1828 RepID=UPI0012FE63FC|nr:hypothetical protein [Rhodococcus fascians]